MRADKLRDHIANYAKDYQTCAGISERIGQLATTHPLLFHALVTGYGPLEARCAAVAAVERGDRLRDVCEALSIPYALRSIPASVLVRPLLPAVISEDGARLAALRVGRAVRSNDQEISVRALFYGASICDEAFGLWLAHPQTIAHLPTHPSMVRSLAFYAWHSRQDVGLPDALDHLSFSPRRGWASNVRIAVQWFQYFKFVAYFGDDPIADTWAEPYRCGDYEIVPLRTAGELLDEALLMDNCLRTYADDLDRCLCRLFSVRRSSRRLGTVEIRPRRDGRLQAVQFRGPRNAAMDLQPWDAVHDWISRQKPMWARPMCSTGDPHRRDHFQTFIQAHERTHALPDQFWIGIDSLKRLEMELELLNCHPSTWRRAR